jgi:hypothetical protein
MITGRVRIGRGEPVEEIETAAVGEAQVEQDDGHRRRRHDPPCLPVPAACCTRTRPG